MSVPCCGMGILPMNHGLEARVTLSEEAIRQAVAEGERRLAAIRVNRPERPIDPPVAGTFAPSAMSQTVLEEIGTRCVAVHARIAPAAVEQATARREATRAHERRLQAWQRDLRGDAYVGGHEEELVFSCISSR